MSDAVRALGRRGGAVPRVIWRLPGAGLPRASAGLLRGMGHCCVIVPESMPTEAASTIPPDFAVMIEIAPDTLRVRRGHGITDRLHALGRTRCAAVILLDATLTDLKAGWPTHRFQQLRDAGVSDTLLLHCPDAATAKWAAANSTAAGVIAAYDSADPPLSLAFAEAALADAAVLATSASTSATELSFRTGDADITAAIAELPLDPFVLEMLLADATRPWTTEERKRVSDEFALMIPAPRASRVGHALDDD